MRVVEIRRHAERDENEDLTARGLARCELARETLEFPYDSYVVSPKKRARLTMEALGIEDAAVDERLAPRPRPPFAGLEEMHKKLRAEGRDIVTAWFAIPRAVPILEEHGRQGLAGVLDLAARLPEHGRALAVSHGGTIEPIAVVAANRPFGELFGDAELGYCEGVRVFLAGGKVARIDVVRLPP